jgi:hypothetical protein
LGEGGGELRVEDCECQQDQPGNKQFCFHSRVFAILRSQSFNCCYGILLIAVPTTTLELALCSPAAFTAETT